MQLSKALNHPIFKIIQDVSDSMNMQVWVVGGFVRDFLLRRPNKDIDVVCIGNGIELAKAVAAKVDPKIKVHYFKNFGTAMFKYGDYDVEFIGARKESYNRGSRKPVVENGTLEDDQNRRDFTINALAISLNEDDYGEMLDSFNGTRDLENGIIKTPLDPQRTFDDDPLRMMRAIRFASQLNFIVANSSFDAIEDMAERIKIVSQERITDELNKIVLSPKPSVGFKLLEQAGLLQHIFPEFLQLKGVETIDGKSHKDNFYHTLEVLDNICEHTNNLWLRWAAILHDIAKPATKRFEPGHGFTFHGHEFLGAKMAPKLFRKLRLPLDHQMKYVQKLVKLHLRPIALVKDEVTDSAIRRLLFDAGDDIDDLMTLCRADITSKNPNKVKRYLQNFKLVEQKLKEIEEKDKIRNFQPPIKGEEIMAIFDLKPCKQVGDLKNEIKEAILEGTITNSYEAAYKLLLKLGKANGLNTKPIA